MSGFILAIDQGTTSSRAIIFDQNQKIVSTGQQEFTQHFPHAGWVEHDAEQIWDSVLATCKQALAKANIVASDVAAIGITNQRETVVVWDKQSGTPIHNAIVWQDRRTAQMCTELKQQGLEAEFTAKTGLLIDPYFSATKLAWLLNNVDGARQQARDGQLLFGTIDSFLIWRLTGGKVHRTDATNAARTMLYNINTNQWDQDLLDRLDIPQQMLPEVCDCAADFGITDRKWFDASIPICGVAGDQQAATLGQACFSPGMLKSTYGTGCFALLNTGNKIVPSSQRLLSTIAYRLGGKTTYALEGSIFMAGASVQWLRDGLGIIDNAAQSGDLANQADPGQSVYLVPAFVGLGAPYWDADARGALYGLTRNTGPAEIVRATLQSVAYQTRDLLDAMYKDWPDSEGQTRLRVDGGMVASDWTMQFLADILDAPVDRPQILETTALGAAWLAGQHVGLWPDQDGFAQKWRLERQFLPKMSRNERQTRLSGWHDAVRRTLST